MRIPLMNRLKRQKHKEIAALQDAVLESVYSAEESAVLHGGTAIWRCFQGNRFSEDLDFYLKPKDSFRESLQKRLMGWNVRITKFRRTANAVYSNVENDRVAVSLEIALRSFPRPVASPYEKVDGTTMDVFTPSANELLMEKLGAFQDRKLVRDLYDVYHLGRFWEGDRIAERKISGLLQEMPKPADEHNLKNIVLSGAVPTTGQMMAMLKKRFSN